MYGNIVHFTFKERLENLSKFELISQHHVWISNMNFLWIEMDFKDVSIINFAFWCGNNQKPQSELLLRYVFHFLKAPIKKNRMESIKNWLYLKVADS